MVMVLLLQKEQVERREESRQRQTMREQRQKTIQRVKQYMEVGTHGLSGNCAPLHMVALSSLLLEKPRSSEETASSLPEALPETYHSQAAGEKAASLPATSFSPQHDSPPHKEHVLPETSLQGANQEQERQGKEEKGKDTATEPSECITTATTPTP